MDLLICLSAIANSVHFEIPPKLFIFIQHLPLLKYLLKSLETLKISENDWDLLSIS